MSGRHWTPYQLEIVLHHTFSLARFDRENAPLYPKERDHLIEVGLLEWRDGIPKATEKGLVFVEMLLQTPVPRNVYLDPRDGKEIMPEKLGPLRIEPESGGLTWKQP